MTQNTYKTVLGTVVLAMLASAAPADAAVLPSEALQWQYNMDANPASQDLDGDTNVDWEANFTPTPSGGFLPMTTGQHLQMLGSVGTHLWKTANITGDYTVEVSLQIGTTVAEGSLGTTQITSDPAGSSYVSSWLGIKRQGQFWGTAAQTPLGGASDDNTDDFHTFRIALKGNNYFVWRDGVGLRDSNGNGAMPSVATGSNWNLDRLKIGNGNGNYQGAYDVDYVYIEDEAYSPPVPELPLGVTLKYDFDVDPSTQDLDEDGFGFNLDWKKVGTANLSGGIASMGDGSAYESGYTNGDSHVWQTGNFDGDYKIEFSAKIESVTEGMLGAMGITADPNGMTGLSDTAWLNIHADGQSWGLGGNYGPLVDLGTDDNTDGFHAFKIIYQADEGFFVYRDDVLLNTSGPLGDATPTSPGYNRVKFGDLGSVHGGQFQVDYISLTKIPEPGSLVLLWLGCVAGLMVRRRG